MISDEVILDQKDSFKLKIKSEEKGIFEIVIEKKWASKDYASLPSSSF